MPAKFSSPLIGRCFMAGEAKRIYLDTNILAYVANTKAPQHQAALEIFRPTEREILCVSSQV
ncbi:hypothetical protein ARTHRO_40612 [Limnospira indica PCC 8005]|uniref:PIN domain-containing protein n=2 Tax=Limnospira TaxID=2596745 RepID=A0A9P1KH36_9CYAN|nr:hypothetical protein ARTHRO_40612 [Limnospira indica PCC 8005]